MKSNKLLTVILVFAVIAAFALSACSSNTPAGSSDSSSPAASTDSSGQADSAGSSGGSDNTAQQIAQTAADYAKQIESEAHAGAVSSKDTLTFGCLADPGMISLDSMLDFTQMPMNTACLSYFVCWDSEKGEFYSPVCDSYALDADQMGVTFHIIPGIKMNDGNEFQASDLVTSIEAFRAHSGMSFQLDYIDLDNTKVIDNYTVDLRFKAVNGVWESSFEMFTLISGKAYDAVNGDISFYQNPAGPQAYDVSEWVPGDHITFTRFDDYYGGTPPLKTIVCKIISDPSAAYMALQNGDIDLLWNLSGDEVQSAYTSDNLKLVTTGQNYTFYMGMNCANAALSDFRVRQAICMAVNQQDVIDGAFNGFAYPMKSILTPEAIGYDANAPFPAYDLDKAKQLLADAGYGDGLTLRIVAQSTPEFQLAVEVLTNQLAAVGITLQPSLMDYAAEQSVVFSNDTSGYDLYLKSNSNKADSIAVIDNPMLTGATHWELSSDGSGAGFNAIFDQIRATLDINDRAKLYGDLQTYFFQSGLYWLPLAIPQTYIGMSKDLTGLTPYNAFQLNFDQAYFR